MKKALGVVFIIVFAHTIILGAGISPVQNGVLDLTRHNWKKEGIVKVSGRWEFYWLKLYSPVVFTDSSATITKTYAVVPGFWNRYIPAKKTTKAGFGFATYHVKIICPAINEPLALKLLTVQGAYKLFINGEVLTQRGKVGTNEAESQSQLKPVIVKVKPVNNILDVVMQVSNFDESEGGLWDTVEIGTQRQVQNNTIKNISIDFIVAGIFILAFLYNLILYLQFKKQYTLLFFSILCLLIFVRIFVTGEMPVNYLFNISWSACRRLEFISLYLCVPSMALFSYFLFPLDFNKKVLYIVVPTGCAFVLVSFFGTYYQYTSTILYYQAYMIATALYGLYVYVRAAVKKRVGSHLFLLGFAFFLATIINDVLYVNLVINTMPLYYAGLMFFVLKLFFVTSKQFSRNFHDLENANLLLAQVNSNLSVINNDMQERNTELYKINHELDVFVHRTSHDLRAPLSSVAGVTYLMENETNVSTLHDYAVLQQKTLRRMDNLIEDIIDFSKNKRLTLAVSEIAFKAIVYAAIEDHKHSKNANIVSIETDIEQTGKFVSDERRISTIINNLISNSIKYVDASKQHSTINIKIKADNHNATIIISDNGIGIDEDKLGKIFTMFYRATSSETGSGLGLYITKETVEKLDGTIIMNSEKNQGTTITISLPDKSQDLLLQ